MGVAITPNVNFPSVVVTTVYPGADPATVETNVTRPIEDAIAGLPNIEKNGLTSISSQGVSTVMVQFTTAANPDLVGGRRRAGRQRRAQQAPARRRPADRQQGRPQRVRRRDGHLLRPAAARHAAGRRRERHPEAVQRGARRRRHQHPLRHHPRDPRRRRRAVAEGARPDDQQRRQRRPVAADRGAGRHASRQGGTDFSVYFDSLAPVAGPARRPGGDADPGRHGAPARRREDRGDVQEARRHRAGERPGRAWRWSSPSWPTRTPITVVDGVRQAIEELTPQPAARHGA